MITWLINLTLLSFFLAIRYSDSITKSDSENNCVLCVKQFTPSDYDVIFCLFVGYLICLYIYKKLFLFFFNPWERMSHSPAYWWFGKHFGFWVYTLMGALIAPPIILLPGIPFVLLLEFAQVHLGDLIVPNLVNGLIWFISRILDLFF